METLFDLLGVDFAKEGDKAGKSAKKFKSLGVEIDLQCFGSGVIPMGHTQDRKEELSSVLNGILKEKAINTKQAESLRGRLHWFKSFAFGRVASSPVKALGDPALSGKRRVELSAKDVSALQFLCERVLIAPPLAISPSCLQSWVIFTDGACEGQEGLKTGGIGGVLINPSGSIVSFFGGEVPAKLMSVLLSKSKNPIYELEVLPVVVSAWLWGQQMQSSQVCWYLDNEAGRSAYIKGHGATMVAAEMVNDFTNVEMQRQLKSWFARVPSLSNLADSPSRLKDDFLLGLGAVKGPIDWMAVGKLLGLCVSVGDGTAANQL